MDKTIVNKCRQLLCAYNDGLLGDTTMPEEAKPKKFSDFEERLAYFTLPMALNYQRDSYKMWQAALATYEDPETRGVFHIQEVVNLSETELRFKLSKHKLALQPNKHVDTWARIAQTFNSNWGGITGCLSECDNDFLLLRDLIQVRLKKGFPYLSGPKIFNYWAFILNCYGGAILEHMEFVSIAPDTHITKCSILLGVISELEAKSLSKEEISERWRQVLSGSGITPIAVHAPLWFWSRNGFAFRLQQNQQGD